MTNSEKLVYEYLTNYKGDVAPSVRDVAKATGIKSTSTVHNALLKLSEKGLIVRQEGFARSVRIKTNGACPVIYKNVAEFVSNKPSSTLDVVANNNLFAICQNSSNEFDGISKGDVILFEKTDTAKDGDLVIVNIGRQTLLRRYEKTSDGVILTNDSQPLPLLVPDAEILARAVGMYRQF